MLSTTSRCVPYSFVCANPRWRRRVFWRRRAVINDRVNFPFHDACVARASSSETASNYEWYLNVCVCVRFFVCGNCGQAWNGVAFLASISGEPNELRAAQSTTISAEILWSAHVRQYKVPRQLCNKLHWLWAWAVCMQIVLACKLFVSLRQGCIYICIYIWLSKHCIVLYIVFCQLHSRGRDKCAAVFSLITRRSVWWVRTGYSWWKAISLRFKPSYVGSAVFIVLELCAMNNARKTGVRIAYSRINQYNHLYVYTLIQIACVLFIGHEYNRGIFAFRKRWVCACGLCVHMRKKSNAWVIAMRRMSAHMLNIPLHALIYRQYLPLMHWQAQCMLFFFADIHAGNFHMQIRAERP